MKVIIKINILFLLFNLFLIQCTPDIIVLPFKFLKDKSNIIYSLNNISGKDFLDLTTNKLITSISVGTPLKQLEIYLTMDYNLFFIGKGYCEKDSVSYYEPKNSNTFHSDQFYYYPFDDLRNMTIGNDTCEFFDDFNLKTKKSFNFIHLLYGSKINLLNDIIYQDKICGIMGFKLHSMENSYYSKFKKYSLENSLRANNISNYTDWTIQLFDDNEKKQNNGYDGYIIFGATNDKYLKDIRHFNYDDLKFSYVSTLSSAQEWGINFKEIYYNNSEGNATKMTRFLKSEFNFDLDYYFATKEYFDAIKNDFFKPYLQSNICKVQKLQEFYLRYQFIVCDKSFNKEFHKFPTLYFPQTTYNYTFNLTYTDCFKEIGNQILFLLFYDPWSPDTFKFGKSFLKKYNFIFRYDAKNIGFMNFELYNENGGDNNNSNDKKKKNEEKKSFQIKQLIWIFILLVLLIGITIGIFVGKKIWDKQRKKRAMELPDDDYEYRVDDKRDDIINE